MPRNARDILLAYLHDPPDKALAIAGHQRRARQYIEIALGDAVSPDEVKDPSDALAAVAERFPSPHWQVLKVDPVAGRLTVHHPLSGSQRELRCDPWDEEAVAREFQQLVAGVDDTSHRFLLVWRGLRERLANSCGAWFHHLPADTRVPDHTIWNHLDTTAGLKAAQVDSGAAFLSFALGPVQPFIEAARTVRDLWSGSMILSWMTFQAMLPLIDELGPTALVYPTLRGLPWLDVWLRETMDSTAAERIPSPPTKRLVAPCLPNRFLAMVPWGVDGTAARHFAEKCRQAAANAWREIADSVQVHVNQKMGGQWKTWDDRWSHQVDSYFDIRTAILPWRDVTTDADIGQLLAEDGRLETAFPHVHAVRQLAEAIPEAERPQYSQNSAGIWQARVELSARLMQALRSVRHVPPDTLRSESDERFPPKCSLLGTYEQVGPDDLGDSRDFWKDAGARLRVGGVRLRDREGLCAIALAKRFSGPCFFQERLNLRTQDIRYEDTATIAASDWLTRAKLDPQQLRSRGGWSGQWLHWPHRDFDADEPCPDDVWDRIRQARDALGAPPAYYAILALDGDDMGRWLRGEKSPLVKQAMHSDLVKYFESQANSKAGLDARRPVGPTLHAAVSEALSNFALHFVPAIIQKHSGMLIYAGGDDVLALLPSASALQCARELRQTFRRDWWADENGQERLLMGSQATVSAGLAIVHYKEDLQLALQAARNAEKAAKDAGRDALRIAAWRRSGERADALCPWEFAEHVQHWVEAFLPGPANEPGATDRWAYRLSSLLPTLRGLPVDAMAAEIRRQVARTEKDTWKRFERNGDVEAADLLVSQFTAYHELVVNPRRNMEPADALEQFVTLCKTASFLARGRDE